MFIDAVYYFGMVGRLPTDIHTYADHWIAVSFAFIRFLVDEISIFDSGCVAKIYPEHWDNLVELDVGMRRGIMIE